MSETPMLGRTAPLLAEGIGTFVLVLAGGLAIALDAGGAQLGAIGVALVFGLAVATGIFAFGPVSGAHFNPAVTLAFWVRKDISGAQGCSYVLTQLVAATAAATLLNAFAPEHASLSVTQPHAGVVAALIYELVTTFVLVLVILSMVDRKAGPLGCGLAIGAAVCLGALGGAVSGASMNPARSLGPAFVFGPLSQQWIYVLAPCGGALLAAGLRALMQRAESGPAALS